MVDSTDSPDAKTAFVHIFEFRIFQKKLEEGRFCVMKKAMTTMFPASLFRSSFSPNRRRMQLLLFSLFLLARVQVNGQEAPSLFADMFATPNVTHRSNICFRQEEFYSGRLPLRDALQGLEIHPVFGDWGGPYFYLDENGVIPEEDPGLLVLMMDELATRAGFTWRNSYGTFTSPPEGTDWTDMAAWTVRVYDVSVDYWFFSVARLNRGVTFLPGWLDSSYIMVGEESVKTEFNFLSWMEPFNWRVWSMVAIVFLVSGVQYWCMAVIAKGKPRNIKNPTDHFFLPALALVGQFEFSPVDAPTMMLTWSLAFFSILLISAYTANLASFFVVRTIPSLGVVNVQDAMVRNFPICFWEGTAHGDYITEQFPNYDNYVPFDNESDMLLATSSGGGGGTDGSAQEPAQCRISVMDLSNWETYRDRSEYNPDCAVSWIGRVIQFNSAGLTVAADAGTFCTSLIRDVLTLYLEEMKADGFINGLIDDHRAKVTNQDCSTRVTRGEDTESQNVTLKGMSAVFVIQLVLATLAVLASVATLYWKPKPKPKPMPRPILQEQEQEQKQEESSGGVYTTVPTEGEKERNFDWVGSKDGEGNKDGENTN